MTHSPVDAYIDRLSEGSRRTMLGSLNAIARYLGAADAYTCDWANLRYADTQAIRNWLAGRYSPAGANKSLAALKGCLREVFLSGGMDADSYQRAILVKAVPGTREAPGRSLTSGEVKALFDVCDLATPAGARDAACLAVAFGAGLRRTEMVNLDAGDYRDGALHVRSGKGNRSRVVPLPVGAVAAIDGWLSHRGAEPGPLLLPIRNGGHIEWRRLGDKVVAQLFTKLADKAGVKAFSPHSARRTYITGLLAAGIDLSTVQRLAGHSLVTTTTRYDRRGLDVQAEAVTRLNIPYGGA